MKDHESAARQEPHPQGQATGDLNAEADRRAGAERSGPPSNGREARRAQVRSATSDDLPATANPAVAAPPAPQTSLHPETSQLVERFATALAEKLRLAEQKYGYSDGWKADDWMDECRQKLREHIDKGDPRDVAAYCAFLWYHKESTKLPAPPAPTVGDASHCQGSWDWNGDFFRCDCGTRNQTGKCERKDFEAQFLTTPRPAPHSPIPQTSLPEEPAGCDMLTITFDTLKLRPWEYWDYGRKLRSICERQQEQIRGLKKDADRYRWLRGEDAATNPAYYKFWQEFYPKLCRDKRMDKLIDAAMSGVANE